MAVREIIASRSLPVRSQPGEVPERLNGRDWKSRDGGNLVRGFESLPLRSRAGPAAASARRRLSERYHAAAAGDERAVANPHNDAVASVVGAADRARVNPRTACGAVRACTRDGD